MLGSLISLRSNLIVSGSDFTVSGVTKFSTTDSFKLKLSVAQNFIIKVGKIAETEGHHPDIWFGWGYAKIKIFTNAIKGLHESDFILAAKVDKIF